MTNKVVHVEEDVTEMIGIENCKMMSINMTLSLIILVGMRLCLGTGPNTWIDVSFRINKLNFIWSKAIHHLSDKALIKRLKDELDNFDSLYLSAKAASIKNEKLVLEEVDNKLVQLLEKYGLGSAVTAYMKKYKWRDEEEENGILSSEKFKDPKLQKLWHAAQNSRFSKNEQKIVHKELRDHERKMALYEEKVQLFNELNDNTLTENSFEMSDKLNRELKVHHNNIINSYDKLHQKILQVSRKVFNNEKVENLWHLATQNPNFTMSELESIRVELNHFDKRLEKMKYHDEELKAVKKEQEKLGKLNVFDEDISGLEEENKRLLRKLRKLENYLETKIVHTEL
ncbi:Alpha-2-macroglobulin RAP C-terminal domain family protein [Brugia pahangi]